MSQKVKPNFVRSRQNVVNSAGSTPAASYFGIIRAVLGTRKLLADIPGKESHLMPRRSILLISLLLGFIASLASSQAQMPPAKKDPLSLGQNTQGKAGCSATEASSCAEAAAKILPIVMGRIFAAASAHE